jgi:hypothetical protein
VVLDALLRVAADVVLEFSIGAVLLPRLGVVDGRDARVVGARGGLDEAVAGPCEDGSGDEVEGLYHNMLASGFTIVRAAFMLMRVGMAIAIAIAIATALRPERELGGCVHRAQDLSWRPA